MPLFKAPRDPAETGLMLHSEVPASAREEDLGWVRYVFQSLRARLEALEFQTIATERAVAVEDWRQFVENLWLPKLAPHLLRAWDAARHGRHEDLMVINAEVAATLPDTERERSIAGGVMLLRVTQGAKYQAALGAFRRRIEECHVEPHLAVVWSALAALFQLPPTDLLSEYLREEWLVSTKHCAHHEPPQGPLSFSGLAHRALHEQHFFPAVESGAGE
jgi:hypothetical protein